MINCDDCAVNDGTIALCCGYVVYIHHLSGPAAAETITNN